MFKKLVSGDKKEKDKEQGKAAKKDSKDSKDAKDVKEKEKPALKKDDKKKDVSMSKVLAVDDLIAALERGSNDTGMLWRRIT